MDYFYFAGRPVAQLKDDGTTSTWTFLTTDHLGTPLLATDLSKNEIWRGPFEPFGRDVNQAAPASARAKGIFLGFPGQWDDGRWQDASAGADIYYNVHRWYEFGTGRYGRTDPLGLVGSGLDLYGYAGKRPLNAVDRSGLKTCVVLSLSHVASLGGYGLFIPDHAGLYVDRPCAGDCAVDGPFIYDPSGHYNIDELGGRAGTGNVITPDVPGWGFDDYTNYQCTSEKAIVEVYCFETSCCDEKKILDNATELGGGGVASCATNTSQSLAGAGPFAEGLSTLTPKLLRRTLNRMIRQGADATTQRRSCQNSRSGGSP